MPKGFAKCVRAGGRVRTLKPRGTASKVYMHVCYLGGKSYAGEVKRRKAKRKAAMRARRVVGVM